VENKSFQSILLLPTSNHEEQDEPDEETSSNLAMRATDNLKRYISNAILPPVPVIDEPTTRYNTQGLQKKEGLMVVPANWRHLHAMRRMNPMQMTDKIMIGKDH
jgi:hypothetical protein